jgi:hypothetical protein
MLGWEDLRRRLWCTVLAASTTCGGLGREFVEVVERIVEGDLSEV